MLSIFTDINNTSCDNVLGVDKVDLLIEKLQNLC